MSRKRGALALLAFVAAALAGGRKALAAVDPNLPVDPNEPLNPIGPVVFDPPPPPPEQPIDPGIFGPANIGDTPIAVWQSLVSPTPRVNRGYQFKPGETVFGVLATALKHELGRQPTQNERMGYYRATGRVRTNLRLYATSGDHLAGGSVERYMLRDSSGATLNATLAPAACPWHDRWHEAMQAGAAPVRLIAWSRQGNPSGPCSGLVAVGGWQLAMHGVARTFGCLWLPSMAAIAAGLDVTDDPAFDWPPQLWAALGIERTSV